NTLILPARPIGGLHRRPHVAVVMMPGEDCGSTAMRSPGFGKGAGLLLTRPIDEAKQASRLDLDGQIARRPYVWPPFSEQEIDSGGPAPNALDSGEVGNGLFVIFGEMGKVECARSDQLGQATRIAAFLAGESGGAESLVACGCQPAGICDIT